MVKKTSKKASKKTPKKAPKIEDREEVIMMKIEALYDIELELVKALPKMARASSSPDLKMSFESHFLETKEQVKRLESIFQMFDVEPRKLKSAGIRGILDDSTWVMKQRATEPLKDMMIASSARYAEHYEMAGYLSAIEEAKMLGLNEVVTLLEQTLAEEEAADKILESAMQKEF